METHECDGCLKMIRGRRCWTYDYDLCTSCFACLPRKEMRRFMETLVLVGKQQQSYSVPGCWALCAGRCRALLFTSAMEGSFPLHMHACRNTPDFAGATAHLLHTVVHITCVRVVRHATTHGALFHSNCVMSSACLRGV